MFFKRIGFTIFILFIVSNVACATGNEYETADPSSNLERVQQSLLTNQESSFLAERYSLSPVLEETKQVLNQQEADFSNSILIENDTNMMIVGENLSEGLLIAMIKGLGPSPTDIRALNTLDTISDLGISDHSKQKKRHICPVCGNNFARLECVNRHMRIHTGEQPFICPYSGCGYTCNHEANFSRHQRLHTGNSLFRCSVEGCDFSTSSKRFLNTHKKRNHCTRQEEPPAKKQKTSC